MTHTQIGLLAIQLVVSVLIVTYIAGEHFSARRERQKYRLFAMRDKLLELVAEKRVEESDQLFKLFYTTINKSILEVKDLTLVSFIKASLRTKISLEEHHFYRMVDDASPEMREFVLEFASTWMDIMKANSVFLLFLVHIGVNGHEILKRVTKPRFFHTRIFQAQRQEIYAYRYFADLRRADLTSQELTKAVG